MQTYHDDEWCVPSHDDQYMYEMLVLEGAQAGLSWSTVLNKRENYHRLFCGFDVASVACFTEAHQAKLLGDAGIVRNRLKVKSAVTNARAVLDLHDEGTTLSEYMWAFVDGTQVVNNWRSSSELPAHTDLSDAVSKAMKKRGFTFVGTTIVYSFLQAVGIVDDHIVNCPARTG